MTVQYDRQLSLVVGTQGGNGVDFGKFKVQFQIRRGDIQTPNSCDARIYNVSNQTANKISTKEFTQIAVIAGYPGNTGLIFRGVIKQVRKGRIDAKDTYVDITAADGDEAYNFAPIALSLAKGSQPRNEIEAIIRDMAKNSTNQTITTGYVPDLPVNARVRGRVFYGMARDEMRDFAAANNATWSIQDGAVTLIPKRSYIPGDAVVISPQTGLIGVPEQTQNGIEARILLNPQIKIGQLVKLDSKSVNKLRYGLDLESQVTNEFLSRSVNTNADGLYYVMSANHLGDTRAQQPWYTDLVLLSVDAQVPLSQASKAIIQPESVAIRLD